MSKFRNFFEASGVAADYSSMGMNARLAQGKKGEMFIISQLGRFGVQIVPSNSYHADAVMKIDGYLGGNPSEPVQIKLRRSGAGMSDDVAYEVCRNHDSTRPLFDQLKDPHQQGRDWKGTTVKHYFVLNRAESDIYHIPAAYLKVAVQQAIQELVRSPQKGVLARAFRSTTGVELRPTRDPDPGSFTPYKVMAFVPASMVAQETYPVAS